MSLSALTELIQSTYCERPTFSPIDEPLNLISNLAFAIAAVLAARQIKLFPGISVAARLLPWSLATVAVGSAVYHAHRTAVTLLGDVLPLAVFIAASFFLVLRKILAGTSAAILVGTAFVIFQAILLISVPSDFLNGSVPHAANLLFLLPLPVLIARRYNSLAWALLPVAVLYLFAIIFRTVDLAICPWLPVGTHFLWHMAASAAGFFVVRLVGLVEVAERVC